MRASLFCLVCVGVFGAAAIALSCRSPSAPPPPKAAVAARPAPPPPRPTFGAKEIDAMLRAEWLAQGITPAEPIKDTLYLRRAYLDVLGTLPTERAVKAFAKDNAPDKRAKMVASLLADPAYADHWTNYWDDELIGKGARAQDLDRTAFRGWLRARFVSNAPWNEIVYELVSATGQNSAGGPRNPKAAGGWFPAAEQTDAGGPQINGAVNWLLRYEDAPQDLAGSASRTFLGVQIQCAQCHDHKTEKWKQDDFRRFAACFSRSRVKPLEAAKMGGIRRVEVEDVPRTVQKFKKDPELVPIGEAKPAALDGTDLSKSADVRQALGAWITAKENPWFAKAIVNRMWGHFLGRGFTDPVDDMRPSSVPTMAPLLGKLADEFVASGYDLRLLIETICATEAYRLGAAAPSDGDKGDAENRLWAHFHLVPMGPEELLNALLTATNVESAVKRAGFANVDQLRAQLVKEYTFLFDVDEDTDQASFEGTVSQALVMLNGRLVGVGSTAIPGSALAEVLSSSGTDEAKISSLYLRTLSRWPTGEEIAMWTSYVASATATAPLTAGRVTKGGPPDPLKRIGKRPSAMSTDPRTVAYEDLFWALLNSSEFLFNH